MGRYRIRHLTEYRYDLPVSASYGQLVLIPRESPTQRVVRTDVIIDPPAPIHTHVDHLGNRRSYFEVLADHELLRIEALSEVEVRPPAPAIGDDVTTLGWEAAARAVSASRDPEAIRSQEFLFASPQVPLDPSVAEYARPSFPAGRPVLDAVADLSSRIHREFTFAPDATEVGTPLAEVLDQRAGVCQDFAHLMISGLRAHGLPARYVSGYIETIPPPGQPKLLGSDVSHAWVSVFVPDRGWVDIDPTNDQWVADRHLTTAWGRDYGDVSPVKGVIYTDSRSSTLHVAVDVLAVT